ncbi:hypothetical protein [Brevundimonas subvibrioides]|uniref:hypothetical protein n=1 Tax=Brevundimonas subvibrioides TaxID=74313 RepID=UPI0022B358D7|nr:hypothetical protein [Brevundimonas subvibrioides]
MTDTRDDTADIAWMRQLAEEGGRGPMKGAAILMAAGLIYGTASLLHWSVASGLLSVAPTIFNVLWLGATALFLIVVTVVSLRLRGIGGVRTTASRGANAVWSAVGWGIFALFTSLAVIGSRMENGGIDMLLSIIPSAIMAFYGLGWAVTATLQKSRPLMVLTIACFVAAPVLALMAGMSAQYLAYSACLFGLMALPGFILMRAANRS